MIPAASSSFPSYYTVAPPRTLEGRRGKRELLPLNGAINIQKTIFDSKIQREGGRDAGRVGLSPPSPTPILTEKAL